MAGAAASPTLDATEVLTGLVTTGVLADVEAVLLQVAEVVAEEAGVEAAGVVAVFTAWAVTAARRAKAVMLAPFETICRISQP